MKKTAVIVASVVALATTSSCAADSVPTPQEYTNAIQVVRAYRQALIDEGVLKNTKSANRTKTKSSEDPTLKQLQKIAKEQRNRFEVIKKTINRYDPAKTNLFARPARASMQTKLNTARSKASEYWTSYTNKIVQTFAYSNAYVVAQRVAASATAKIQDEIAYLRAKIVKYEEYKTKYPVLKTIWNALIEDAQNRIKVLEALTA